MKWGELMEYKKLDLGTYKLHMIKTDKFKTIRVKVSFRRPIKKSEVTIRNILCNVLTIFIRFIACLKVPSPLFIIQLEVFFENFIPFL